MEHEQGEHEHDEHEQDEHEREAVTVPVGYSSRCRVCNSPHRVEIEQWCKEEGLSPRAAAARLLEVYGEKVSHQSVWQHMRDHFDVQAEAREQYRKSRANMEKGVGKTLSDIEMLEAIAQGSYDLNQAAAEWVKKLVKEKEKIPGTLVDLLATTAGEVRQQIRTKLELLGEDPGSKIADAMVATLEELQELYQDANSRQEGTDS